MSGLWSAVRYPLAAVHALPWLKNKGTWPACRSVDESSPRLADESSSRPSSRRGPQLRPHTIQMRRTPTSYGTVKSQGVLPLKPPGYSWLTQQNRKAALREQDGNLIPAGNVPRRALASPRLTAGQNPASPNAAQSPPPPRPGSAGLTRGTGTVSRPTPVRPNHRPGSAVLLPGGSATSRPTTATRMAAEGGPPARHGSSAAAGSAWPGGSWGARERSWPSTAREGGRSLPALLQASRASC